MECNKIKKQLAAWVDRELSARDTQTINDHLQECPACNKEAQTLAQLARALDNLPKIPAPPGFSRRVCAALAPAIESPDLALWWQHLTLAWRSVVCGAALAGLACGAILGTVIAGTLDTDNGLTIYRILDSSRGIYL